MKFRYLFTGLASALVVLASSSKRDVSTIQTDIASLGSQSSALDTASTNFGTSTSPTDALANLINEALTALSTGFSKAALDTNTGGALGIDDSVAVLCAVYGVKQSIINSLQNLIDQRTNFNDLLSAIDVPLIQATLIALQGASSSLGNALSSQTTDVGTPMDNAFSEIDTMLTSAVSAYALLPS